MNPQGIILKKGSINGRPADLQILKTPDGPVVIITSDKGEMKGFKLD
jgi:hypothetical protein